MDVRHGDRGGQRLHPQAFRARSERAGAPGRAIPGGGRARGAAPGGSWRQGDGRCHSGPSGHRRDQLRRFVRYRALRVSPRGSRREARAGHGRGQEPWHRDARRRSRPGGERPRGCRLRLGGRTLHGAAGGGAGGRGYRRPVAREADPGHQRAARRRLNR